MGTSLALHEHVFNNLGAPHIQQSRYAPTAPMLRLETPHSLSSVSFLPVGHLWARAPHLILEIVQHSLRRADLPFLECQQQKQKTILYTNTDAPLIPHLFVRRIIRSLPRPIHLSPTPTPTPNQTSNLHPRTNQTSSGGRCVSVPRCSTLYHSPCSFFLNAVNFLSGYVSRSCFLLPLVLRFASCPSRFTSCLSRYCFLFIEVCSLLPF